MQHDPPFGKSTSRSIRRKAEQGGVPCRRQIPPRDNHYPAGSSQPGVHAIQPESHAHLGGRHPCLDDRVRRLFPVAPLRGQGGIVALRIARRNRLEHRPDDCSRTSRTQVAVARAPRIAIGDPGVKRHVRAHSRHCCRGEPALWYDGVVEDASSRRNRTPPVGGSRGYRG